MSSSNTYDERDDITDDFDPEYNDEADSEESDDDFETTED